MAEKKSSDFLGKLKKSQSEKNAPKEFDRSMLNPGVFKKQTCRNHCQFCKRKLALGIHSQP